MGTHPTVKSLYQIEDSACMTKQKVPNTRIGGIVQSHKSSFSTLYRLVDLMCITFIYFALLLARNIPIQANTLILLFVSFVSFLLIAEALDLYRSWRMESTTLLIRHAIIAWIISSFIVVTFAFFFPSLIPYDELTILLWLVACGPALTAWRIVFRELLFWQRQKGHNSRSAIVIGATSSGYNLAMQILQNEHLGIQFKGVYDDREPERLPHEYSEQLRGNVGDAIALAKESEIDFIYIALPMSAEERIMHILNFCSDTTCTVSIIPNVFIYNLLNARWQTIGPIHTLSIFDTPFQGASNVLKRLEDMVLAILILAFIAVPMLLIAALVKITSPGPAVFKQKRYGLDGKDITVYKFRSMTTQDNGPEVKQATKFDARITPLGAFLRKTSLDELPQFINVLQGRMSIVGPRPHAIAHNEEYRKLIEGYMLRHKVRPGITGWAQINGFRGETETVDKMTKRVEFDLDYIHRWSVWLDIKIILATVFKGFINRNAY
jgi:putative colanic acid biosynthesis UDP-glucose lipid carrier transferase